MAEPRTWQEVFDEIQRKSRESGVVYGDPDVYENFIDAEMDMAKVKYPFMHDKSVAEYGVYVVEKRTLAKRRAQMAPPPTAQQFWNAAYAFSRSGPGPTDDGDQLYKLLSSDKLGAIPLGKLWGQTTLKLIPAIGALPTSPLPPGVVKYDFSATDSGAIMYADGHPSEEAYGEWISSAADDKLRRITSLGWVIRVEGNGSWARTGHVLVMDMARDRDRHPWFVLASEWPSEEEQADGGFVIRAPEKEFRDDKLVHGVFPGDKNRTPICKIQPWGKSKDGTGPVLKRFGEDFEFAPVRLGGHRRGKASMWGPELAHVMDWYWDDDEEEEVCYHPSGVEYMRYKPEIAKYRYPALEELPIEGSQGFAGELEGVSSIMVPENFNPLPRFSIPLDEDIEALTITAQSTRIRHPRYISSTPGF